VKPSPRNPCVIAVMAVSVVAVLFLGCSNPADVSRNAHLEDHGTYQVGEMSVLPTCSLARTVYLNGPDPLPPGASVQLQIARDPEFQSIIHDETRADIRPQSLAPGNYGGIASCIRPTRNPGPRPSELICKGIASNDLP